VFLSAAGRAVSGVSACNPDESLACFQRLGLAVELRQVQPAVFGMSAATSLRKTGLGMQAFVVDPSATCCGLGRRLSWPGHGRIGGSDAPIADFAQLRKKPASCTTPLPCGDIHLDDLFGLAVATATRFATTVTQQTGAPMPADRHPQPPTLR
jgi:hypothetical protein